MPDQLIAGTLLSGGRSVTGWVLIRGDRIAAVGEGRPPRRPTVRAAFVAPGLCDLHVNGAAGLAVTDGSEALQAIDAFMLQAGVTAYLPTVMTMSPGEAEEAVRTIGERVRDPSSPIAGIHLEGPFLNPAFVGVHDRRFVLSRVRGEPPYYCSPHIRRVTLAPEVPGALELITALTRRRIRVSIGHSRATAAQAAAAAQAGAVSVTHLFNAMAPGTHHAPNIPGWALATARISLTVIADGLHVDPLVLRIVARAAENRVCLVTDSTPGVSAPDGAYHMGGVRIVKTGDRVTGAGEKLAGGGITLHEMVLRWSRFVRVPMARAWVAGSERPGRLIGRRTGLRPGKSAELVLLDENFAVRRVMFRGGWVE